MDPVSVTGSVIAMVQLTTKVLSILMAAKDASKDRERCTLDLSNSCSLLISLRFRLEDPERDEPWFQSVKALNASNGPLHQYYQALEELQGIITSKSRTEKLWQTVVWTLKKEEIASILLRIERLKGLVQVALELDHFKLAQVLRADIGAVKQNTDELWRIKKRKQLDSLTEWISNSTYPVKQSDIIRDRQEGTGFWFLNSREFRFWLQTPRQTLFCPGIPGAGKTMISAIAIDHLTTFIQTEDAGVAHIYCNYQVPADQTVAGFLAAIIKQLVQSHPASAKPLKELYDRHESKRTRPSPDEIIITLQRVLAEFISVFIVVDALDECPTLDCSQELVTALQDLQANACVRLMFTSRFITEIQNKLKGLPKLEIRARNSDVKSFVSGSVNRLPQCIQQNDKLRQEVEDGVVKSAKGMFLLAHLFLDSLQDKERPRDVRKSLKQFSKSVADPTQVYDEAYCEALERINNQLPGHSSLAKKLLGWITHARRQLRVTEICHALSVEQDDEDLDNENLYDINKAVSKCAGLVTIDEKSGIVRLVHYTAQEYFKRTHSKWLPTARVEIASTCLTYLMFSSFQSGSCKNDADFKARKNEYAFLDYAARHWGDHVAEIEEEMVEQACEFLQHPTAVKSAGQALSVPANLYIGNFHHYPRETSALHLIARFGLLNIATRLYQEALPGHVINALDQEWANGSTPLTIAASYDQLKVAQWLLGKGADINARGENHANALEMAIRRGHEQMLQLLLNNGAKVPALSVYVTALQAASLEGHEPIVQLLLDNEGSNVNEQGGFYGNALQAASGAGHEQIVHLLLNNNANVNAQGGVYGNALQAASLRGHKQIVQLLLDKNANVNAQGGDYGTALQAASSSGHEQIIQLLLDNGADVNVQGGDYGSALHAASYNGHEQVVNLLLSKNADVHAQDGVYGTALQAAKEGGHKQIEKLLRDWGA